MDILLHILGTLRGSRLLSGTSSSPTSTSPRWHLIKSQASDAIRFDDVSGATSFGLVATLRFEVATGTSREKRCIVLFLRLDTQLLRCWRKSAVGSLRSAVCSVPAGLLVPADFVGGLFLRFQQLWELFKEDLVFEFVISVPILRNFQPFVLCSSNPRALFTVSYSGEFPWFPVVVLLVRGSVGLLSRSSSISLVSCIAVVDFLPGCEVKRQYRTLISLLGSLATMRRVVNYHSSWARQQQVELFDASGNPGSTAGRGFNPAGGAQGGG
ncbi:hypothetical protein F511_31417 [Dorcoceras hygrometricum]|uniref:Uncharacterized protein n=1 Tax=Dorcoceras hygrometricum TaxID=472368 RepID=A0A2Z7AMF7_9LAMI|nr:hypothetical protein F511_31417 [Dorcoceras hygrometricum]